jgi:hypothetical protein
MKNPKVRKLVINFAIELVVYGLLVLAYFLLVLRYLNEILTELYNNNLITYAFLGLGLVVAQGVVLEFITSFIISKLRLERLD